MLSLRASLSQISQVGATSIPHGFHSCPQSLRQAMHAMLSPRVSEWKLFPVVNEFDNEDWTEECNGVTTDGHHWFFSSSNKELVAIHKFSAAFGHMGKAVAPSSTHIGDIDYFADRIYAPLDPRRIGIFDTAPTFLKFGNLDSAGEHAGHTGLPWCAINPWNGFLYSSNFNGVTFVYAYDPNDNFRYKGALRLQGPPVGGVQGGVFTPNGHLYLTSDVFVGEGATQDIRAYSVLNGAFLGSVHVPYSPGTLDSEEMEGLTIWKGPWGHVHVIILDNDATNKDDVFFKHFIVPDDAVL
jgi:hypothetical protein